MCNHYLGYFYTYEGIDEITKERLEKGDFSNKEMIGFLDNRIANGYSFKYCPNCGEEFDRKGLLKLYRSN